MYAPNEVLINLINLVTQGRFTRKPRAEYESSCDEIDESPERPFSRLASKLTTRSKSGQKHLRLGSLPHKMIVK